MAESTLNGQEFSERLTQIIEANLQNEQFGVTQLVREMKMSHSSVHRAVKNTVGLTISQFICQVRLKKAQDILKQNPATTVSEVAYACGFHSVTYFTKCFSDYYGFSPGEVRKKIADEMKPDGTGGYLKNTRSGAIHALIKDWISHNKQLIFISAGVILLMLLFSTIYYGFIAESFFSKEKIPGADKSVMVLPFKNLSSDADNQYFADGIAEDILNRLSRIKDMRVISKTSSEQFRDITLSAVEISRKLNVNYILEGSVQRENEKIRIHIQFIDAKNDRHLWSENYDRQLTDIFAIQSDIAKNVANELQFVLSPEEKQQIEKIPTKNTEAYNSYLMGRFHWYKRTPDAQLKSIEYFEKAISIDPDYALAYTGLADVILIAIFYSWNSSIENYIEAKKLALKALEIDNNLAEAYAVLGHLLYWYEWDWEGAKNALTTALDLNPKLADTHHYYAQLMNILGEKEEARQHIELAIQLDPYIPIYHIVSGICYYHEGKYQKSIDAYMRGIELDSMMYFTSHRLFFLYYKLGDYFMAAESLRKSLALVPETQLAADEATKIYHEKGIEAVMEWWIELEKSVKHPIHYHIARLYLLLGQTDEALLWLEKGVASRKPPIPRINSDVFLDSLHFEEQFLALIDTMGLTPYHKISRKR